MTYLIGKQERKTGLVSRLSKRSWNDIGVNPLGSQLCSPVSALQQSIQEALLNPCANLSTGSKIRVGQRKVF